MCQGSVVDRSHQNVFYVEILNYGKISFCHCHSNSNKLEINWQWVAVNTVGSLSSVQTASLMWSL